MEAFIKRIFDEKTKDGKDEEAHSEFLKFSKGIFKDRYLIEAKKQANGYTIKTSAEFANFFVRACLEKMNKTEKVSIKGAIISTLKLKEEIDFPISSVKQFAGIKQVLLDGEIEAGKIIELMNKYPRVFFALSFTTKDNFLKVKAKAPRSGKPSTKGDEEAKADFCTLKTNNQEIIKALFFENSEFKEARVNHTIEIKNIELPKGVSNPQELREKAMRIGRLIRKATLDGKTIEKAAEFRA